MVMSPYESIEIDFNTTTNVEKSDTKEVAPVLRYHLKPGQECPYIASSYL